MRLSSVYAHYGPPATGLGGLPTVGAWQSRARLAVFGTPRMTDIPANKPPYVSAPERCP
jgi:hypothetical protein